MDELPPETPDTEVDEDLSEAELCDLLAQLKAEHRAIDMKIKLRLISLHKALQPSPKRQSASLYATLKSSAPRALLSLRKVSTPYGRALYSPKASGWMWR